RGAAATATSATRSAPTIRPTARPRPGTATSLPVTCRRLDRRSPKGANLRAITWKEQPAARDFEADAVSGIAAITNQAAPGCAEPPLRAPGVVVASGPGERARLRS